MLFDAHFGFLDLILTDDSFRSVHRMMLERCSLDGDMICFVDLCVNRYLYTILMYGTP